MGFNKKIISIDTLREHHVDGTFDQLMHACKRADVIIGSPNCIRVIELYHAGQENKLKKLLFSK